MTIRDCEKFVVVAHTHGQLLAMLVMPTYNMLLTVEAKELEMKQLELPENVRAKTKFILIDCENVRTFSPADLEVLEEEEFVVKLFLGVNNKSLGVDLVDALLPIGSRVELVRLKTAGTNALDFVIAFYLGKLWCQQPKSTFYIISKDTDFDILIKNFKAGGVDIHRRACLADILKDEAATMSMDDFVATATAALRKISSRPSTPKTLRNVINVKKQFSEEQLTELMGALSKSGFVQIAGNKVTYNLEAGL